MVIAIEVIVYEEVLICIFVRLTSPSLTCSQSYLDKGQKIVDLIIHSATDYLSHIHGHQYGEVSRQKEFRLSILGQDKDLPGGIFVVLSWLLLVRSVAWRRKCGSIRLSRESNMAGHAQISFFLPKYSNDSGRMKNEW